MLTEIKAALVRNADTLAGDAAGLASVFVLLLVGLHLPNIL